MFLNMPMFDWGCVYLMWSFAKPMVLCEASSILRHEGTTHPGLLMFLCVSLNPVALHATIFIGFTAQLNSVRKHLGVVSLSSFPHQPTHISPNAWHRNSSTQWRRGSFQRHFGLPRRPWLHRMNREYWRLAQLRESCHFCICHYRISYVDALCHALVEYLDPAKMFFPSRRKTWRRKMRPVRYGTHETKMTQKRQTTQK